MKMNLLSNTGNEGFTSYVVCESPPPFAFAHLPWMHVAVLVVLAIYAACMSQFASTFNSEFFERDPTQSYKFHGDTVSDEALTAIALLIPSTVFVAGFFLIVKKGESTAHLVSIDTIGGSHYYVLLWSILGLLMCLAGDTCMTETIKCLVGRHRPCFFYLCDYKGYKDAVDSGNYTEYNSLTVTNAVGDLSYCRASASLVDDGQKSLPSGHAATSFCSMLFLVFFIRWAIRVPANDLFWSLKSSLAATPLLLALWIAITRLQDCKHSVSDVLTGAIIGSGFAYVVWKSVEKELAVFVKDPSKKKDARDVSDADWNTSAEGV
mmetsp:Transcript_19021/g.42375  ORF Transcript_19021/g.42375 Transcript_19021/m.42375 type:complete len:321 (-) Transcript_19021:121-1083(-)